MSLLLVLGLGITAFGQGSANIVGTVTDPSGAVVPNAKITLTNLDNGFVQTTDSNATGSYRLPGLVNGRYSLQVEQQGFKTYDKKDITLDIGMTVRVDVSLQIGSVGTTVTVEENALQVQADTNDVSQTVTDTQISNLATNGRNILQLVPLVPGAASQMPDFDRPGAQFQNRSVEFNGMRSDNNDWTIDGGEAYDRGGGGIMLVSPSQDALSEFTVTTSNYAADLGDASGAMTQMAIKSGSKQFHAAGWEYDRNDALDAFSYRAKDTSGTVGKKDELRYNAFGFNAGGPVEFKSSNPKTFFFYNQEWRREVNPGGTFFENVFTQAERNGTEETLNAFQGNKAGTPLMWVPETPDTTAVAAFNNAGLVVGQAIPSNDLSKYPSLLDANALAYVNSGLLLNPNSSDGRHYSSAANETEYWREEIGRVDHQFNDKIGIFASAIYDSDSQAQPNPAWTGNPFPTINSLETVPSWQGVVHMTMNLKPNLLNEISFNENGNNITIANAGLWNPKLTKGSSWAPPALFANANTTGKWPGVNIGGGQVSIGENMGTGNWPWKNWWRSNQLKDDLSYIKGTHSFKVGFGWLWTSKVQQIFVDTAGNYGFFGSATGCSTSTDANENANGCPVGANGPSSSGLGIGDFLLGFTGNFNQPALQDAVSIHFQTPDAYAIDDWRITRRLTLNLGIRWEALPHAYDAHGRMSNFYPFLFKSGNTPTFAGTAPGTTGTNSAGVKWTESQPNTNVLCTLANTAPGVNPQTGCGAANGGNGPNLTGFLAGSAIKGSQPSLAAFEFYMNGIGLSGQNGTPKGLTKNHDFNLAPRVGFAYDVFGDQKTILRGGGGVFFERNAGNEEYNMGSNVPFIATTSVNNVFLERPGVNYVTGQGAAGAPVTTSGFWTVDPNLKPSTVYQYSMQIQEQLKNNIVATLGYVGNNSVHLSDTPNINTLPLNNISNRVLTCGPACGGANNINSDPYRIYPGWGQIGMVEDEANSHYHSLQATIRASEFHSMTFGAAYTLGHVWDEQDAQIVFGQNGNVSNPFNPKYDYGTSGFDRRQVVSASFSYNVPIFQHSSGIARTVAGGWTISGIVAMQAGNPLAPGGQADWSGLSGVSNRPNQLSRAEVVKTRQCSGGVCQTTWYNPQSFALAGFDPSTGLGVFGNSGKNPIPGPGRQNWNLSLYKDFKFTERAGFQFRAESFNTWNHGQFFGVNGGLINGQPANVGNPNTNNPSAALLNTGNMADPRVFQLGGKLYF